jgi:urease beta subunit
LSGTSGPYLLADDPIEINAGRATGSIDVWNTGDRAVQVGSHYHFFESNRALRFDRAAAFGMRLDIPAGTAVRFEPGDRKTVHLVALGGVGRVIGLNALTQGLVSSPSVREAAMRRIVERGYATVPSGTSGEGGVNGSS